MTTLKEEEPFAFAVATEFLQDTCSFCFAFQKSVHLCKGCHVVAYCNEKCQKSDWINHKNECQILKKLKLESEPLPRHKIRLTMRILLKSEKELAKTAFNGRSWNSLEDHLAIVNDEMSSQLYENISYIVDKLKPLKIVSREEAEKAFSKVIANSVNIINSRCGTSEIGAGLYLGLSIHKHSCVPDSQLIFTGTKASLRSFNQTTEYSPNLKISYCTFTPWIMDRKNYLTTMHCIDCTCPICSDKNHITNRMGSSCRVSCCEDAAGILDENSSGPYRCNKCGKASTIMFIQVKLAQEKIKLHMQARLGADPNEWSDRTLGIIFTSEKILSVYNFCFINLFTTFCDVAAENGLHQIHKYAHEKALKAFKYYWHEMDRRRVIFWMESLFIMRNSSDFDGHGALKAVMRTFGKDHPVTIYFKRHVEAYDLTSALQRVQLSEVSRKLFNE